MIAKMSLISTYNTPLISSSSYFLLYSGWTIKTKSSMKHDEPLYFLGSIYHKRPNGLYLQPISDAYVLISSFDSSRWGWVVELPIGGWNRKIGDAVIRLFYKGKTYTGDVCLCLFETKITEIYIPNILTRSSSILWTENSQ